MCGYAAILTLLAITSTAAASDTKAPVEITPKVTLTNPAVADQDDMCVWVNPEDPAQSVVITSDKSAGKLFVYDLDGGLVQSVAVNGKPGNIDLRDGFPLDGTTVSIVAFNERDHSRVHVYAMDPITRTIRRVDDGQLNTGVNYGFTLYHSRKSDDFFAFTVPEDTGGFVEQYRLTDNGAGTISGEKVRSWPIGHSEGCVTDDRTGLLYIGEEAKGIWRVGAEPDAAVPGTLIQPIGRHGLTADVEGLAVLYGAGGTGYLLASSQGSSTYLAYRLDQPLTYVKTFAIQGAGDTDGIDVVPGNFGPQLPAGFFALHNGAIEPCPIQLCDLRDVGLPLE